MNRTLNTSTEPTSPKMMRRKRWIHSRQTRHKTPGSMWTINADRYDPLMIYTVSSLNTQKKREYAAPKANDKQSIITPWWPTGINPRYRTGSYSKMALNTIIKKEIEWEIKGRHKKISGGCSCRSSTSNNRANIHKIQCNHKISYITISVDTGIWRGDWQISPGQWYGRVGRNE